MKSHIKKEGRLQSILGLDTQVNARQMHPYHQVDGSPWPILMSLSIWSFAINIINLQVKKTSFFLIFNQIGIIIIAILWWRDVIREAKGGYHTFKVQLGILIGFMLFLISEIMLFFSQFWAFFHSSLAPAVEKAIRDAEDHTTRIAYATKSLDEAYMKLKKTEQAAYQQGIQAGG